MERVRKFRLPAPAVVALSFNVIIVVGTALLCIPCAAREGGTPFIDAMFTAVSAVCVTGLTVLQTFNHWSLYGQIVIIALIQIGGLGFITIISIIFLYAKKHTTLSERKLVMQSAGGATFAGLKKLVKYILIGTAAFEALGAFVLCFAFVPVYGWGLGIWQSVFTSISAFCNAGFTITDADGGVSLCNFAGDPVVTITVVLLIIIGGVGFFVWGDVVKNGIHLTKYSLHSKIVLSATGALVFGGWLLFALLEWNNPATIGDEGVGTKLLATLFMSVTPRTAGFNSIDYADMSAGGILLSDLLMFVGGSPGSTAGGVKTTTAVVFICTALAVARRKEEVHLFKRRFERDVTTQAAAVICLYLFLIFASTLIICAAEGDAFTLEAVSFEVFSAVNTVGLSMGITPQLGVLSKLVLMLLMTLGRVGGFTFILLFAGDKKSVTISRVSEKIMVG